jgi:two-component system phosphate regulon sensor histidine kinase PhoR
MNLFKRTFYLLLVFFLIVIIFKKFFSPLPFFLLSISILILLALFFDKRIRSHFDELERAISRIRNEDFDARLDDLKGKDFINIARQFNNLASELKEHKESSIKRERELLNLIDCLPQGLLLLDKEFKVIVASKVLREMFPYFREDAPIASLSIPSLNAMLKESREEEKEVSGVFPEMGKGKGRVFSIYIFPLLKEKWAISISDVTIEKNLENIKSDLVSNISHELRTPLSATLSLLEVLEFEKDKEKRQKLIEKMKNQILKMTNLLNDLMSLSRIESGEYELRYEDIDVKEMIESILSDLNPLIMDMGIKVKVDLMGERIVYSDGVLLQMILKNLIENGVKYNKNEGSLFITTNGSKNELKIEIEDTGEGILEEYRERIFERFFRIDSHRSKEKGGTGLGLAIVKHSLKMLNGIIDVQSEIGKGSKFKVVIPLNK